jgi:hypothetical protein
MQMVLRQNKTAGTGDPESGTEVLAPSIDLTDQYINV